MSAQLGSLVLHLEHSDPTTSTHLAGPSSHAWLPMNAATLSSLSCTADSQTVKQTLLDLLADDGLGFEASYRYCYSAAAIIVRASILPSDAVGSAWKRSRGRAGTREKLLRRLFGCLRRGWDGDEVDEQEGEEGGWLMDVQPQDEAKMPQLYASIPSPPEPALSGPSRITRRDEDVHWRLAEYSNPEGIRTPLYQYQARSIAKMLQMETRPDRLVDPLWTPFAEAGREGTYYVNLTTWDIQRHPGWYDLPRGGILCEQMGVGKTLMCLALVVSTLHQACRPPPHLIDLSPVLTAHTESTYPFPAEHHARTVTSRPPSTISPALPSLVHLCANLLAKVDRSAGPLPVPPLAAALMQQKTWYYEYPHEDDCMREAKRRVLRREIKKIWMSDATLVVVPSILVQQWKEEIGKHLEEGVLRVLEIGKEEVPPVEDLLDCDVVLMDVDRFGQEESYRRFQLGLDPSNLLQIRWKRIILDEGHVAGIMTSNAMHLAMKLNVERRWVVSGTPTKHLQQGGEAEVSAIPLDGPFMDPHVNGEAANPVTSTPVWPRRDLEDSTRIGLMIGGFLACEPFRSEGVFQQRVTSMLRGKYGPKFDAVRRLKYLMDNLMVKHERNVIDREAKLPPSAIITETLQFYPMQRVTYNVLAALITSNVYTSNFEDQDYFLHPKNLESFNAVVKNVHLACFWYSAKDMGVEGCLRGIYNDLEKKQDLDPEARKRLTEAAWHLERALAWPGWTEWMTNGVSVPFEVDPDEVPEMVRQSWSDSMDTAPNAIDAHSLAILRRSNARGKTVQELCLEGWESRLVKCEDFVKELERAEARAEREDNKGQGTGNAKTWVKEKEGKKKNEAAHLPNALGRPRKGTTPTKKDRLKAKLEEAEHNAAVLAASYADKWTDGTERLARPLPSEIRTRSRSAKVDFVLDTILSSEPADKFVIFGDTYELGHLTEALDLFDITLCFAGKTISAAKRIEALRAFERPDMRVCLLDLNLAARGLNLVCANRMIFLSPVWSPDVQAQAIKRVHRIGQTRPTKVQILVTEGTFEEDIARRSSAARSEIDEVMYSRAMIENPRFVALEKTSTKAFPMRFVPLSDVDAPAPPAPAPEPTSPVRVALSPDTSTPTDASPTTPVTRRGSMTFLEPMVVLPPAFSGQRDDGHNEESVEEDDMDVDQMPTRKRSRGSIMKRPLGDGESGARKKRAKVAFA